MPSDNQDSYRRMYEMGKELMEMAKMGGYSPEGEENTEDYGEEEERGEAPIPQSDKVGSALSFLRK
jgi:hypothetical protein